jgi:RimJ/RimL family protein N-acetyltransferase
LESRTSPDEQEFWLNWVIRLLSGELAGYVQATVLKSGISYVAYELNSKFWRQGIGSNAVSAMMTELCSTYAVHTYVAVLKRANFRSMALLTGLGFHLVEKNEADQFNPESDECVMIKILSRV